MPAAVPAAAAALRCKTHRRNDRWQRQRDELVARERFDHAASTGHQHRNCPLHRRGGGRDPLTTLHLCTVVYSCAMLSTAASLISWRRRREAFTHMSLKRTSCASGFECSWGSENGVRLAQNIFSATAQPPYSLVKITGVLSAQNAGARKVLGWPKRCKLARAFLWEHRYRRLKLAQLLGRRGVSLTCRPIGPALIRHGSGSRLRVDVKNSKVTLTPPCILRMGGSRMT